MSKISPVHFTKRLTKLLKYSERLSGLGGPFKMTNEDMASVCPWTLNASFKKLGVDVKISN